MLTLLAILLIVHLKSSFLILLTSRLTTQMLCHMLTNLRQTCISYYNRETLTNQILKEHRNSFFKRFCL